MASRRWWIGLALALLVAGCGGEDPMAGSAVQPMGAAAKRHSEQAQPEAPSAAAEPVAFAETDPNRAPRVVGLQVTPASSLSGQDVTAVAIVQDADGDEVEVEYTWLVNDVEVDARGEVFPTRGLVRGDTVRVRVVASDGRSESRPVLGPVLTVVNGPPVIVSQPRGADADGSFRYQVRAEDPDGDRDLRYRLERAPAGMSVTLAGGLVTWDPAPDQSGAYAVEIVVQDAEGGEGRQAFELTALPGA